MLNQAAKILGIDFTYQPDTLTNNLNAFKQALDKQKNVLFEFKVGDYGITILDDRNEQQKKAYNLSEEWARGLISTGFFVGRGGLTGDITAAGKMSVSVSTLEKLNSTLNSPNIASKVETTASDVNAWWRAKGYENPYLEGTKVYEITLAKNTNFVRVFSSESNMAGGWVMKAEDIQGLTAQQIQQKFSLPSVPTSVCDVELKAGDTIRMGLAGPLFGQPGGGIQYDLMGRWIGTFTNSRPLQ